MEEDLIDSSKFNIYYTNADSIRHKVDQLRYDSFTVMPSARWRHGLTIRSPISKSTSQVIIQLKDMIARQPTKVRSTMGEQQYI